MVSQAQKCVKCNVFVAQNDQFCATCGTAQKAVSSHKEAPRTAELVTNRQQDMEQVRNRMATQMANEIADRMPGQMPAQTPQHTPQSTLVNVSTPHQVPMQTPNQTINFNMAQPAPVYQPVYYPQPNPTPSSTFVVMTFVMYFILFPVGVVMNWIGLLCGPYRGWHAVMFFFIQVPSVLMCIAIIVLFATGVLP